MKRRRLEKQPVIFVLVIVAVELIIVFSLHEHRALRLDLVFSENISDKAAALEELKLLVPSGGMPIDRYVEKIWADDEANAIRMIFNKQDGYWVSNHIIDRLIHIRKIGATQRSAQTIWWEPLEGGATTGPSPQVEYAPGSATYHCGKVTSNPFVHEQYKCYFVFPKNPGSPITDERFSRDKYRLHIDPGSILNQYFSHVAFDEKGNITIDLARILNKEYGLDQPVEIADLLKGLGRKPQDIYDLVFFKNIGSNLIKIDRSGRYERHIIFDKNGTALENRERR